MTRVLLIGPLPPPMGGDTRHFVLLLEDLKKHPRFAVELVNTSRAHQHSRFTHNVAVAVKTLFAIVRQLRRVDVVSFHASDRGMFWFGPAIMIFSRLSGKPAVLRIFGGSFGDFYQRRTRLGKFIVRRWILSADAVLLQTQRAVDQLRAQAGGELIWFSTYIKDVMRPDNMCSHERVSGGSCRRFVFLGHLWRSKGVDTMLDCANRLPPDCSIDLYGPLDEYTAEEIQVRGLGRIRYRGFLSHAEVDRELWNYDCLVLPTYHPGEGYPGVIAEAFAHALPVVTTRWLAMPEIVDESCGILIEPRNSDAFVAAIATLHRDRQLWLKLKAGAAARAEWFNHTIWSEKFSEVCERLAGK